MSELKDSKFSYKPLGNDAFNKIELIAYSRLFDESKFRIDQMPLLAARISTARDNKTGENEEKDMALMKFLAENKHLTPYEHQTATFRVVAPLFVFREWHRHRTQSYNEMSMRYTSDPVGKFYIPMTWRKQDTKNKQGSSDAQFTPEQRHELNVILGKALQANKKAYAKLVELGAARELARLIVPVANYSEMYATANLRNWHGFWKLRADKNAQWEIRQYAYAIDKILTEIFPRSWLALKTYA